MTILFTVQFLGDHLSGIAFLMKKKRLAQLIFSLLFLAAALPMLFWGFWPPRREVRVLPLLPVAGLPSLPGEHMLRLEFSPEMRAGDSQVVELNLSAEASSSQAGNFYEQYNVIVESRLELAFTDVRPADEVLTAFGESDSVTFYWEVHPREVGELRGTLWLYLRLISGSGREELRQPVSVQLLEIRSNTFLGWSGREARGGGILVLLVGLLFGIPLLRKNP